MGNYFGYERISTEEDRKKQKFTRQDSLLKKFEKENGIKFVFIGRDDASGKSFENRPDWDRIEQLVHETDTIVFPDIERFTRGDEDEGFEKYMELMHKGIELIFIKNPTVNTSYIKQLLDVAKQQNIVVKTSLESIVRLLLIVELHRSRSEREILGTRIKDGIAASSKKSGRKIGSFDKLTPKLEGDILEYLSDRDITQASLIKKHKISKNTLKKYIAHVKQKKSQHQIQS